MPSDLTPEQREAALNAIADHASSADIDDALDALLALGWRPEPQPDATAAAEARGRREGIEAAAKVADAHAAEALSSMCGYGDLDDALQGKEDAAEAIADAIRGLSSIPPAGG